MSIVAKQRGILAEQRVARHLWWRGWRLCARTWIGGGGELDIVASRWRTLLIVEVRQRVDLDAAFASVDDEKRQRTRRATQVLLRRFGLHRYGLSMVVAAVDAQGRICLLPMDKA